MNIAIFEVREDEREIIRSLVQEYQATNPSLRAVHLFDGPVTQERVMELKELQVSGISALGGSLFDGELLKQLQETGIRAIAMRCIGLNHVDLDYAKKAGIQITNASYPPNAVADFTLMLMLISLRKYKPALWRQQVNDYSLAGLQGRNLNTMTVGIIGSGKIGKQVLKNLTGFGCRLLTYNIVEEDEIKEFASYVDLATLYRESDMISIHVPLTPETENMIDSSALDKMKDGVILINTSRGELMNIQDMIAGIEDRKIGTLAMDVFENDLSIYHQNRKLDIIKNREMAYLRQFPNVILTQHMAFYTMESVESMVRCGIENLL